MSECRHLEVIAPFEVIAPTMFPASYDALLVLFSVIVAVLASYTALDMAGRISTASGRYARLWLAGGAVAMGLGI